jgi:Arc/MetJ family transcription regulator
LLHTAAILMHTHDASSEVAMRTTLNIDDALLEQASRMTGVKEKTALVRLGLEALIARESARRLARLGGSEKTLTEVPRRREV